jgi:hypothetical protein
MCSMKLTGVTVPPLKFSNMDRPGEGDLGAKNRISRHGDRIRQLN